MPTRIIFIKYFFLILAVAINLAAVDVSELSSRDQEIHLVRQMMAEYMDPETDFLYKKDDSKMRSVMIAYPAAVEAVLKDPKLLQESEIVREDTPAFQEILKIAQIGTKDIPLTREKLKAGLKAVPLAQFKKLEKEVDTGIGKYDFSDVKGITQLAQSDQGVDLDPKLGNITVYVKNVLANYFKGQATQDKKAMIASYLNNSMPKDEEAVKAVAFLKRSDPFMLKLLQAMGDKVRNDKLRNILQQLKNDLPPIRPWDRERMLGEIQRKNNLKNIDIIHNLGAASVGQTFIAEITDQDNQKKKIVLKLLRPGAKEHAERAKHLFRDEAEKIPGMIETFRDNEKTINEELDLRTEYTNLVDGNNTYNYVTKRDPNIRVKAVKPVSEIDAQKDWMAMDLAQGQSIASMNKSWDKITGPYAEQEKVIDALARGEGLQKLGRRWFTNAMFYSGFNHGDLHGGNIMQKYNKQELLDKYKNTPPTKITAQQIHDDIETDVTMIDFGNVGRLSKKEQQGFLQMMIAVSDASLSTTAFYKAFTGLMTTPMGKEKEFLLRKKIKEVMNNSKLIPAERFRDILAYGLTLNLPIPKAISTLSRSQLMLENEMAKANLHLEKMKHSHRFDIGKPMEGSIRRHLIPSTLKYVFSFGLYKAPHLDRHNLGSMIKKFVKTKLFGRAKRPPSCEYIEQKRKAQEAIDRKKHLIALIETELDRLKIYEKEARNLSDKNTRGFLKRFRATLKGLRKTLNEMKKSTKKSKEEIKQSEIDAAQESLTKYVLGQLNNSHSVEGYDNFLAKVDQRSKAKINF